MVGVAIEYAGAESDGAGRKVDGEIELERNLDEVEVFGRGERELEGLAADGDDLAVGVIGDEVELEGGGAGSVFGDFKADLGLVEFVEEVVGDRRFACGSGE